MTPYWVHVWHEIHRALVTLAGVLGNLVGVAPSTAVFMAVYEPIKQVIRIAVSQASCKRMCKYFPAAAVLAARHGPMTMVQAVNDKVTSEQKHVLAPLVAGATSGLVASLIRVPTEVVKQRMQSGELNFGELMRCMQFKAEPVCTALPAQVMKSCCSCSNCPKTHRRGVMPFYCADNWSCTTPSFRQSETNVKFIIIPQANFGVPSMR